MEENEEQQKIFEALETLSKAKSSEILAAINSHRKGEDTDEINTWLRLISGKLDVLCTRIRDDRKAEKENQKI